VHALTTREPAAVTSLAGVANATVTAATTGDGFDVRLDADNTGLEQALTILMAAGLASLTVRPPNLDELFLSAYEGPAA
jgi:ABC-2 type transport system ATP-binding protein